MEGDDEPTDLAPLAGLSNRNLDASSSNSNSRTRWALITDVSPDELGDAVASAFLRRGVNVIATSPETAEMEYMLPPADTVVDGFLVRLPLNVTSPKSIAKAARYVNQLTDGSLDYLVSM